MILPFGLTQKPLNHYFQNGVVKFSCREGKLFYQVKHIMKYCSVFLFDGEVKTEEELKKLLSVTRLTQILPMRNRQSLEVVS